MKSIFLLSFLALSYSQQDTFSNCVKRRTVRRTCNPNSRFRTFDGTCNNIQQKTRGATKTPLLRLLPAAFADKNGTPRGFGVRPDIPPSNNISVELFSVEKKNLNRGSTSVLFMSFGQFIDHDLSISPHESCTVRSCPKNNPASFNYPCFPIKFSIKGRKCTPFGRAIPICRKGSEIRDPFNKLTAYLDGSQIYGPSKRHNDRLRHSDGKLKLTTFQMLQEDTQFQNCQSSGGCSLAGDERADENIALTTIHTLWVREHNRIAKRLKVIHPGWKSNRLFQEARKINIAQLQHIVYSEWLPRVVDVSSYQGYDSNVDPSISNSFSTAAFRFGHSLIPNRFAQLNNNYDRARGDVTLRRAFNNRKLLLDRGIEQTVFGLIGNKSNPVDRGFAFGIARRLLVLPEERTYVDLTAFNIQRGRDHGTPTYGAWRSRCRLPTIGSLSDLSIYMRRGAEKAFKKLGQPVNDLDLFAAGISEKPMRGKLVGPTFGCIIRDQFERIRNGDRFYYEAPDVFTPAQIAAIKRVKMSTILCNNLDKIVSIQRNAFRTSKRRVGCERIPKLDLSVF